MQAKSLRDSEEALGKTDTVHFMVSVDTAEVNKKFAAKTEVKFPILSDPTKEVSESYGVLMKIGFPNRWTFYIDKEGIIQKIDKKVKPGKAGEDMLVLLNGLGMVN